MGPSLASVIKSELKPGERLLWSGRPLRGIRLTSDEEFRLQFNVVWLVGAIVVEAIVVITDTPLFFKLGGLACVLVGLHFVLGQFIITARKRARTVYGVTNARIIIAIAGRSSWEVESLPLRKLDDIVLEERRDGSGCVIFGRVKRRWSYIPGNWPSDVTTSAPALEMIERAKAVYRLIRRLRRRARR